MQVNLLPKEISELLEDLEYTLTVRPSDSEPQPLDWGQVLQMSDRYEPALTETLDSGDASDFIVSDASGGYWHFIANGAGWDVRDIPGKPIFRWNVEMIGGDLWEGFDRDEFQQELEHRMAGIQVVYSNKGDRSAFEKEFEEKIDEIFAEVIQSFDGR